MESLGDLTPECIALLHKNNLLKPLIQAEIKNDLFSKLVIDKELEEETIANIYKRAGIKDESDFNDFLKSNQITEDQFKYTALLDIKFKKYANENFSTKVDSHFLKRKSKLDIVIYSIIRVSDIYKSKEIFLRIKDEKVSFGDLAAKYSEGVEKRTRGIVGPTLMEGTHPKLAELLKNSQPGEVQAPIAIDSLFVICRLESYEPAKLDQFMREKMAEELFISWLNSKTDEIATKYFNNTSLHKTTLEAV